MAWVAAQTAGDAVIRYYYAAASGPGLRGGGFAVTALRSGSDRFTLHANRFVSNAVAGGRFTFNPTDGAVAGTITVDTCAARYTVTVSWTQRSTYARATVDGARLTLSAPGP